MHPSKALLKNADLAHQILHRGAEFGVSGDVQFDFGVAWDRSRKVAQNHVKGIHYLMKKNGITEINGRGSFLDPNTIEVVAAGGSIETVTFENAIVATGASARQLPGVAQSDRVVSFEQQILSRELPESIVVVGAGAIGMEFAFILHNYGVRVTILEYLDRVLPTEDIDVSREIARRYAAYGIDVRTSTKVESVREGATDVTVDFTDAEGISGTSLPTRCWSRSGSLRTSRASVWRPRESISPIVGRSLSMSTCGPTFRISTPSVTSPPSFNSRTWPKPRASSRQKRSRVPPR